MIIYKITNTVTGKVYIGQTIMSLTRRWSVHRAARRTCPLNSSLKKHGAGAFKIEEVARATTLEELDNLEIFYIKQFDCLYPKGYNLAIGGNSNHGCVPWNKGKKGSQKAPRSAWKKGHMTWNKGKETPIEVRAKQSLAAKGRKPANCKAVQCIETQVIYVSAGEAAKQLNLNQTSITAVCRGEYKSAGGLTFKFIDKSPGIK